MLLEYSQTIKKIHKITMPKVYHLEVAFSAHEDDGYEALFSPHLYIHIGGKQHANILRR
jgi:hypothetical protein